MKMKKKKEEMASQDGKFHDADTDWESKDRELTTEEQREERNKERGGQKERKEKREGKNEA